MEARRKGQSVTRYEELGDVVEHTAAAKPKAKFAARFSRLFSGGTKSTPAPAKHLHHEYGRVRHVDTVVCVHFYHATACNATHGIVKTFLSICPSVCLSVCQMHAL